MFLAQADRLLSPGANCDDDDDELPPLEDMSEILATKFGSEVMKPPPASPTLMQRKTVDAITLIHCRPDHNDTKPFAEPFKKGFLNSKQTAKPHLQKGSGREMPFLKAKDPQAPNIPEFFKVKLEDSPRDVLRKELIEMLEPTKEIVKDVMDNKIIKVGLEDPEVLFAVQEIAANPDAIQKHKYNPKVANFYSQLGKLMGSKLQLQDNNGK